MSIYQNFKYAAAQEKTFSKYKALLLNDMALNQGSFLLISQQGKKSIKTSFLIALCALCSFSTNEELEQLITLLKTKLDGLDPVSRERQVNQVIGKETALDVLGERIEDQASPQLLVLQTALTEMGAKSFSDLDFADSKPLETDKRKTEEMTSPVSKRVRKKPTVSEDHAEKSSPRESPVPISKLVDSASTLQSPLTPNSHTIFFG